MKPRGSDLMALVAFLCARKCPSLPSLEMKLLLRACVGGSGICRQVKYTWKPKAQRSAALKYILANYVVSKVLDMEKGGTDGSYLHSTMEAVFDPLPLFKKPSTTFRKHTCYTTQLGDGGNDNQKTQKSIEQTSSNSGNKPISLPHLSPMKYFGITCHHQLFFNFL